MSLRLLIGCAAALTTVSLASAAENSKQPVSASTTERFRLAPAGTVRFEHSVGYLTVEGWDQPVVEVTVNKVTERRYAAGREKQADHRLERMRIHTEPRSDAEIVVTTVCGGHILPYLPPKTRGGVAVEYQVHVPRDVRLVIHHDGGYVLVSDVAGDIDASNHSGDLMLMVPEAANYAIDAKSKLGAVLSDLGDVAHRWWLMGERFDRDNSTESHRVRLRVRWGSITIKALPPNLGR
jgi:hypothetical protein